MQQWVMKQGRLIVHTRSYNATIGNEARKTHCSHKEVTMQTMGNEALKTHCSHKELHVTMGNESRKTHCSYKELQCNNG
ncbi:hypothetical protein KSS87_009387 [Heliosperma pusillum]|nr:hypothetical protein KSS87_009387 [Heliosperma pusillum]